LRNIIGTGGEKHLSYDKIERHVSHGGIGDGTGFDVLV
jgi:hypothetical protein